MHPACGNWSCCIKAINIFMLHYLVLYICTILLYFKLSVSHSRYVVFYFLVVFPDALGDALMLFFFNYLKFMPALSFCESATSPSISFLWGKEVSFEEELWQCCVLIWTNHINFAPLALNPLSGIVGIWSHVVIGKNLLNPLFGLIRN